MSRVDRLHEKRGKGGCLVPWILLGVVVLGLTGTIWWGYQKRETVVDYAVTSLLDRQLGELLPEGEDPDSLVRKTGSRTSSSASPGPLTCLTFSSSDWRRRSM